MTLNVNHKVGMLACTAFILIAALTATVLHNYAETSQRNAQVVTVFQAMGSHQTSDMMHDALRGDVFVAIDAATRRDAAARDEVIAAIQEHSQVMREAIAENTTRSLPPEILTALDNVSAPLDAYLKGSEYMVTSAWDNLPTVQAKMADYTQLFENLEESLGNLAELFEAEGVKIHASAEQSSQRFRQTLIGATVVALVLLVIVSMVVARSIPRPFAKVIGELGELADANIVSAREVTSASETLSSGASEQAASIEEVSATLEELVSMTKRNADHSQAGKVAANEARSAAESGAAEMERMQAAMTAIQQSSQEISQIIKTIDEIAFQTNILALNAAVEAARAGEAGAGFAVVADEVRSLAQRSAAAAKQTAEKISIAAERSGQGVQLSNQVASGLSEIVSKIREVDSLVVEVATASQEQKTGLEQINSTISQMDKITQANASTAEETAEAAGQLTGKSDLLHNAANRLIALVGRSHHTNQAKNPAKGITLATGRALTA